MLLNLIFICGKKIWGSGNFFFFLPDPLIFLPEANMRFKSIIVLKTTTYLHLKRFRERRMTMQVFALTLWVNEKNLPAMILYFLIAVNWLFIICFVIQRFEMINYDGIWNYFNININLYSLNRCDLNNTMHTLNGNLINYGDTINVTSFIVNTLTLLRCLFSVLSILLYDNSNIMLPNRWQLQQIVEPVMIYFMFTFTSLSANVIEKESHYSQIVTPLESFVDILIIFALIGCSFDVLFVLLCDKGCILYHTNKQLQQIIKLGIMYLMVSFVQQENIIAKRSYYKTFGATFQYFIYKFRLLKWVLVFVFS